jgi:hypothetical protein
MVSFATKEDGSLAEEPETLCRLDDLVGSAVYDRSGEQIGTVEHFMIGRRDGRTHYAVLCLGRAPASAARHHPLPWDALELDDVMEGYVSHVDKTRIERGPSCSRDTYALERALLRRLDRYYRIERTF